MPAAPCDRLLDTAVELLRPAGKPDTAPAGQRAATRTIRRIPTEVYLDESDGMPAPCVLTLDNFTVVRKAALTRRITRLRPERMAEVCTALNVAVACR